MAREWYKTIMTSGMHLSAVLQDLDNAVNKAIEAGYVPQGGVSITSVEFRGDTYMSSRVCQAMVWKKMPHEVSKE